MKIIVKTLLCSIICLLLFACDDGEHFAPVTDISAIEPIPPSGLHQVTQGETLYEIAWRYGEDYRTLAERNNIDEPYAVRKGQILYLRPRPHASYDEQKGMAAVVTATPVPVTNRIAIARDKPVRQERVVKAVTTSRLITKEPRYVMTQWAWPTSGKVVNGFSANNKGLNIAGELGEPIYASGAGKVVYAGNGLRAYGNLIIIKHNSLYLSAYAYNRKILVKEGEWVKKGQLIAEMGKNRSSQVMLHFEIRLAGKPINPAPLLSG